jgi:ubiquinone/menaquinone biosynthesis C-methylase UbiE
MKVRESGMPDEKTWNSFFQADLVLEELDVNSEVYDLVEIGFGYGTFSIPAAQKISGNLYGFDIDKKMLNALNHKLVKVNIHNVFLEQRDILAQKTNFRKSSVDYVMLYNILHHHSSIDFLDEAHRILKKNGKIGIIHWRTDITTPRGPDVKFRPNPEQLLQLVDKKKFRIEKEPFILKPYHYGFLISKI